MVRKHFLSDAHSLFRFDSILNAQDVYRIGTLMELIRVLALSFADDGKRVKVCVANVDSFHLLVNLLSLK